MDGFKNPNPLLTKEGYGEVLVILSIPLPTSPCKGEEKHPSYLNGYLVMTPFNFLMLQQQVCYNLPVYNS